MAIVRYKTFADGQILTATDLNGMQDQVINNEQSVGNPRTTSFDLDGQRLILSADGNTSQIASTSNKIDFRLASTDLFDLDGTVATPVNGLTFIASATGVATRIQAKGSDTNIGAILASKGTGTVALRANAVDALIATSPASSVNQLTVSGSATGNPISLAATGTDTNVGVTIAPKGTGEILLDASPSGVGVDIDGAPLVLDADGDSSLRETADDVLALRLLGFDAFIFDGDAASPVNGLTFRSSATTVDPEVAGQGSDTNINVRLTPKGSGVAASAGGWAVDGDTALIWRWAGGSGATGTSLLLQENTGTPTVPVWTTRTEIPAGRNIAASGIASYSPSDVATLDIDLPFGFQRYMLQVEMTPATDSVYLAARLKDNSGSGYLTGLSYGWQLLEVTATGTVTGSGDTADTEIQMSASEVGNDLNEWTGITIDIVPKSPVGRITWHGGYVSAAGVTRFVQGSGILTGGLTSQLTGIRLFFESGNIASGRVQLWGLF